MLPDPRWKRVSRISGCWWQSAPRKSRNTWRWPSWTWAAGTSSRRGAALGWIGCWQAGPAPRTTGGYRSGCAVFSPWRDAGTLSAQRYWRGVWPAPPAKANVITHQCDSHCDSTPLSNRRFPKHQLDGIRLHSTVSVLTKHCHYACVKHPTVHGFPYLAVVFVHCQPAVTNEVVAFLRLQVDDHDATQEPGPARVVVPDTYVGNRTQIQRSSQKKGVHTATLKNSTSPLVRTYHSPICTCGVVTNHALPFPALRFAHNHYNQRWCRGVLSECSSWVCYSRFWSQSRTKNRVSMDETCCIRWCRFGAYHGNVHVEPNGNSGECCRLKSRVTRMKIAPATTTGDLKLRRHLQRERLRGKNYEYSPSPVPEKGENSQSVPTIKSKIVGPGSHSHLERRSLWVLKHATVAVVFLAVQGDAHFGCGARVEAHAGPQGQLVPVRVYWVVVLQRTSPHLKHKNA